MESPYCRDEIMYARTKGIEIRCEFQEPIAGITKIIRANSNQGIFFGGNIQDDRWFELDYQVGKKFSYDIGLTHGTGAALLVSKAGAEKNDIVKVPLVNT